MSDGAPDERERAEHAQRLALSAALVLDPRLADVWQLLWSLQDEASEPGIDRQGCPVEQVAALLRVAYLQGHADAAAESDPGALYRELGVRVPTASARRPRSDRVRRGSSGT